MDLLLGKSGLGAAGAGGAGGVEAGWGFDGEKRGS